MFKPMSSMPNAILTHLRYPQDIFSIEAATLGRYHITAAASFYTASDRWGISPTTGSGSPEQSLNRTTVTDQTGGVVSSQLSPMDPVYQMMSLPASSRQQLVLSDAYVPAGNSSTVQGLSAFVMATSDPDNYGQLNVYITPRGSTVISPVQADSEINQNAKVSTYFTQLGQHGSTVLLGNNLMVPLANSILYVRPFYVTSTSNPLPQLKFVIAVFDQKVGIEPTLAGALLDVFGASGSVTPGGGGTGGTPGLSATADLKAASLAYSQAEQALRAGDLAGYQHYVELMNFYLQRAITTLGTSTTTK
jgi:hypothetical protein